VRQNLCKKIRIHFTELCPCIVFPWTPLASRWTRHDIQFSTALLVIIGNRAKAIFEIRPTRKEAPSFVCVVILNVNKLYTCVKRSVTLRTRYCIQTIQVLTCREIAQSVRWRDTFWTAGVWFLAEATYISLLHSVHTGSGPTQFIFPSSAEVNNGGNILPQPRKSSCNSA
jgi:hypothetical protein